MTYGQLFFAASEAAVDLAQQDLRRRPCIIVSARSTQLISMVLGCLFSQRPVVTYDLRQGWQRLRQIIAASGCSLVIGDAAGRTLARTAIEGSDGVAIHAIEDYAPRGANARPPVAAGLDAGRASRSERAMILFTSGTTGSSKGVGISRWDLDQLASTEAEWFSLHRDDTILGFLPLSFDVGLIQLFGTLYAGGHHVLLQSWLPDDIATAIKLFHPAGLAATPFFWNRVLSGGRGPAGLGLDRLRYVTISGGPLPAEAVRHLSAALKPCGLFKTYGMTEMFRIASLRPEDVEARPGSVGRAYPGVEFAVLGGDGARCAPGEVGDIVAWGAGQMVGYIDADDSSRLRTVQGLRDNGQPVIFTGDRGSVDEDGFLFVHGRRDGMIKILDQRVYPEEVANHVAELLSLTEVVAIPVPRAGGEQSLVVFHTTDQDDFSEAQALARLRSALPGHLVPRRLIRIEAMPYTSTGKYERASLVSEAAKILHSAPFAERVA